MAKIKEFKVNDYITLRLEGERTVIYVNNNRFDQCKILLLDVPTKELELLGEIESVDEAMEKLDHYTMESQPKKFDISPEEQFWGHCSNLQAWSENNYDTRLLHSNLAFPLLKTLVEVGDSRAKKVFREEIAKRLGNGCASTAGYLQREGFLKYLSKEEILFEALIPEEIEIIHELESAINKKLEIFFHIAEQIESPNYLVQKKRVIGLYLNDCGLTEVPEIISELKELKELSLNNNCLKELPYSLIKLKYLEHIELWGNQFKTIPEWMHKLSLLKTLYLAGNPLKAVPDPIKKLKNLTELDIAYCQITELPDWIDDLNHLVVLHLDENKLKKIPESILNIESLRQITLQKDSLLENSYEIIEKLKKKNVWVNLIYY